MGHAAFVAWTIAGSKWFLQSRAKAINRLVRALAGRIGVPQRAFLVTALAEAQALDGDMDDALITIEDAVRATRESST